MDLQTMEKKAQKNKYRTLEQFQADAQTIVHNVVIYHGGNSSFLHQLRLVEIWSRERGEHASKPSKTQIFKP